MWLNYWWVPLTILYYCLYSYISKLGNNTESYKYLILLYILGLVSIWPVVARFSKNIVADGILFDFIIIGSFYGTMFAIGAGKGLSLLQLFGGLMAIGGILMMKVGG